MQRQRSHISLTADGRVIISDNWSDTGIQRALGVGANVQSPKLAISSLSMSAATPIGIVDYGILYGEEPGISGANGTGAIYVHGCPLKCLTCYQPEFFAANAKSHTSIVGLVQLMLDFQKAGVDSISIVIATYRHDVHQAIKAAKAQGLTIPVVYNYSGLLTPSVLSKLMNDVDIFVPDMKAASEDLLNFHALTPDYTDIAVNGINHLIANGAKVIVRHLVIPEFPNRISEVESIMNKLSLSSPNAELSLLIHYMDPHSKTISTVDAMTLRAFKKLARDHGIRLYFQGGF